MTPAPGRVSVVIPAFRRPRELAEAIASALAEGGLVREVLVVDDSPEGSAAPVVAASSAGDARVRYLANPEPSGGHAGRVRNVGWPQAQGEFVHFLDDDDLVPQGAYARAVAAFDAQPRVGLVFGSIEPFGEGAPTLAHEQAFFRRAARRAARLQAIGSRYLMAVQQTFCTTLLVCSAGMVRREVLAPLGGFDPRLRHMEDVELYARIMRRHGAWYTGEPALRYRIGPSLMRSAGVEHSVLATYDAMVARYRADWGFADTLLAKVLAHTLMRLA